MLFEFETSIYEKPQTKLFDLEEGFEKGNMFPEIYEGYKNYKPKCIEPHNEREALLLKIMKLDFAMNDINLYLVLHPNDNVMFEKFKQIAKNLKHCTNEYNQKYQVLELCDDTFDSYSWNSNPWPWEGEHV